MSDRPSAPAGKPDHSAQNAKAAFKRFSLKAQNAKTGRTYVNPSKSVSEQQLAAFQRQLPSLSPTGPGLRVVAAENNPLKLGASGGVVPLDDLISAMEKAKRGTQFYAASTSIAAQSQIQTKIDSFFAQFAAPDGTNPDNETNEFNSQRNDTPVTGKNEEPTISLETLGLAGVNDADAE